MADEQLQSEPPRPWRGVGPLLALAGLVLFGVGALLGLTRVVTGLPPFVVSMGGAALSAIGLLLGLVALARGRRRRARRAVSVGLVAPVVVVAFWLHLGGAPAINDVTTDLDDPPRLVTAGDAAVPFPADTAAVHREAYGDLRPLITSIPPARALAAAATAVRQGEDDGLALIAVDEARGEVRATATSGVFGFVDDVTVRVRAHDGGGARVDVRSRSRQGRGDLGVNAQRVRALLQAIASQLAPEI
ncbi:MAG: DUF1499 domain-containing protein [Deltaproteobacteria bacterium]|nr:DUF1499 domain-containing protein [Deltaproteobacteria bacterium]